MDLSKLEEALGAEKRANKIVYYNFGIGLTADDEQVNNFALACGIDTILKVVKENPTWVFLGYMAVETREENADTGEVEIRLLFNAPEEDTNK